MTDTTLQARIKDIEGVVGTEAPLETKAKRQHEMLQEWVSDIDPPVLELLRETLGEATYDACVPLLEASEQQGDVLCTDVTANGRRVHIRLDEESRDDFTARLSKG